MKIGAAYQIYDDCLDIAGSEKDTGKTLGTDLRKGKLTLPVLMLLQSAPAIDRERYCRADPRRQIEEITELLKMRRTAMARSEHRSMLGQELIREAQHELDGAAGQPSTPIRFCSSAMRLRELLDQFRA